MRIGSIVIHCYEFEKMVSFWMAALDYVPREPMKDGWVVLTSRTGPWANISFKQVPGRRAGKRSRLHLDLYTDDQAGEVARLIGLGAVPYPWDYKPGDDFVVLSDPDDNLFCVVQKGSGSSQVPS